MKLLQIVEIKQTTAEEPQPNSTQPDGTASKCYSFRTPVTHGNILIKTSYKFKFDASQTLKTQLETILHTEMLLRIVQPCPKCPLNNHPGKCNFEGHFLRSPLNRLVAL